MKRIISPIILVILIFLSIPQTSLAIVDISGIEVEFEDEKTVTIRWSTNKSSSGKVLFGKSKDKLPITHASSPKHRS